MFKKILIYICCVASIGFAHTDVALDKISLLDTQEPYKKEILNITNSVNNEYLYVPDKPFRYVALSSGVILAGTFVGAGALYLMPESFTNWDRNEIKNLGQNYKRKITNAPVVDKDDLFLNWVTHPYWGAVYYMQPRVAGYDYVTSAFYSLLASSMLWEYGIEAFAEKPSWQDLVITPAFGSLIGEGFYRATRHIQGNGERALGSKILGKTLLLLMDPVGFIVQKSGLAKLAGINNKNASSIAMPTFQGGALSGVNINFSYRF